MGGTRTLSAKQDSHVCFWMSNPDRAFQHRLELVRGNLAGHRQKGNDEENSATGMMPAREHA